MKKAIAFLLCLCLFAAALPVCAEQSSFPEYTYDNSFLLTVESSENKVYTADDFSDIYNVISLKTVSKIQKEDGSFEYVLMFVIDDFNMDVQKAIFEKYGDKASKNYYAEDYVQRSSYITFSDNEIYLPVGEKGKVEVTDFFIDKNETETLGIDFSFDFGVYPYHETARAIRYPSIVSNTAVLRKQRSFLQAVVLFLSTDGGSDVFDGFSVGFCRVAPVICHRGRKRNCFVCFASPTLWHWYSDSPAMPVLPRPFSNRRGKYACIPTASATPRRGRRGRRVCRCL